MNQQERTAVGSVWLSIAQMYGKEISRHTLGMMLDALSGQDPKKVLDFLNDWIKTSKQGRHPYPSEIIEGVNPKSDPESLAQEAATRVLAAIGKFGWTQPAQAHEYIGELGWKGVQAFGGWLFICENTGKSISQQTLFAQIRDIARATQKLKQTEKDSVVAIEAPKRQQLESKETNLTAASELIESLALTQSKRKQK